MAQGWARAYFDVLRGACAPRFGAVLSCTRLWRTCRRPVSRLCRTPARSSLAQSG